MNRYDALMKRLTDFGDLPLEKQEPNPVSEEQLRDVECELGSSLPSDYREFLRDYGGFDIHKDFPVAGMKPKSLRNGEIIYLCGVVPSGNYDLIPINRRHKFNLLADFITIGVGENGYTLMLFTGEHKGAIYFWHNSQTASPVESENIHFVATSFDQFIHLCADFTG